MGKLCRKFGYVVLVTLLIIGVGMISVGCGNKDTGKVEIKFWEEDDPGIVDTAWDEIIEEFESQNEGIHVVRTHFETESLRQNYQMSVVGRGGPDIVSGPDDNIGTFGAAKTVLDMEKVFSNEFLSTIDKRFIEDARFNGKLYGVPYVTGNTVVLLYNKDIVSEAPKTMNELIEKAKAFSDGQNKYGLVFNLIEPYNYIGFLGAFNGSVFDKDNNITLNTAEMKDTVEYLYSLKNDNDIMPSECDYDQANNLFKSGRAAFIINGPWSFKEYKEAGINLGVTCIPKVDGADYPKPYMSSKVLMLNKDLKGEKLEAAKKFIEFACTKESQMKLVTVMNEFPTNVDAIEEIEKLDNAELKGLKEQVDKCVPMPIITKMRAVWDGMRPTFQKIWSGKINSIAAIKEMQKTAENKAKSLGD